MHPSGDSLLTSLPNELQCFIFQKCGLLDLGNLAVTSVGIRECVLERSVGLHVLMLDKAFEFIDRQNNPSAFKILTATLARFPDFPEAWKERAGCHMDVGNSKKAIKDLLQAQRVCKSPAYSEMLNAQLAWARGDNQLALERITAALALDPKDPRYYHFRAYLRANVDSDDPGIRHEQEMADYNFILDNIPYKRKFIIENNLGYVYYEAGDYNMALKHFTNSIDACKHHVQAYYNRAVAYGDQDMFDKAIAECETIISMNPRSYDAYSLYGWCLLTTGKYVEALKHYRQVAEAPDSIPNGSVCQVYLGLLTALGDLDRVESFSQQQVNLHAPRLAKHLMKLNTDKEYERYHSRQVDESKSVLHRAYRFLAEQQLFSGKFAQARESYASFGTIHPELSSLFLSEMFSLNPEEVASDVLMLGRRAVQEWTLPTLNLEFINSLVVCKTKFQSVRDMKYFLLCFLFKCCSLYWENQRPSMLLALEFLKEITRQQEDPQLELLLKYPYTTLHVYESFAQNMDLLGFREQLDVMKEYTKRNATDQGQSLDMVACKQNLFATIQWLREPFSFT